MSQDRPAEGRRLLNIIAILVAMLLGAALARAQTTLVQAKDFVFSRK